MSSDLNWELAIFDCDGVLVDSEGLTHESLVLALADLGIDLDLDSAIGLFMGNSLPQSVAIIEDMLGEPLPECFFPEWRQVLYRHLREAPVQAVPGIVELLDSLSVPTCVVSNGPTLKMQTTLGVTRLWDRFEGRIYSADSGIPGKPAPDLFLAAAKDLGVRPERSFVVEDSPKGVAGAVAAGMTVFGYSGSKYVEGEELEAAGAVVFSTMADLPRLLAEFSPGQSLPR